MLFDATTFNVWAERWSALMTAALGQSLLWTALVGAAAALLWRASPAVRCWLWRIVAVKLLLVPFWPLALPLAWLPSGSAATPAAVDMASAEPMAIDRQIPSIAQPPIAALADEQPEPLPAELSAPPIEPLSWRAWLMIAWAAVVAAQIAAVAWQWARLRRLLGGARPASEPIQALVAQAAARLKLGRVPRVLVVEAECSPLATGIWRPVIVLPQVIAVLPRAVADAADGSLAPVLAHELAHVKRWDLAWVWVAQSARTLYCFNPLVYWIAFRMRLESELACDAWAMAASGQAADEYADLLVALVGRLSQPAALAGPSAVSAGLGGGELPEKHKN